MPKQNISVTTDCVVFLKNGSKEKVLLVKRKKDPFKGQWAIPGGFLEEDEAMEKGAARELKEETGLEISDLHQLKAFGKVDRDPRGRTISIAFFGVITSEEKVTGNDDAEDAQWFPLDNLPALAFDHDEIIQVAIDRFKQTIFTEKKK
ncbi:NUDIX domain-containing protein [Salinimicrobium soli]|uniref:NUDIX domain-containing protein n=1 Tax=Salinimicrobium soli TaxID=1254399 RepID=UPI003AAF5B80